MRLARPAVLFAMVLAAALPARSDTKQQPPLVYSSGVSLVVLPVFVADGDGRAVRGLQARDFAIEADGKPVEVVSFRYVDTTSAEDQDEIREAPAARRRFFFLFDLSFTDPAGLNRAQRAALDFFRKGMAASDLAAVATVDANRGMKLVANFTDDRILLAHAVQTLGIGSLARISDPLNLAADLAATDVAVLGGRSDVIGTETASTETLRILMRQIRQAEDSAYRAQVATLLGSMADLGKALRRVEGRKQVLYFSSGFDSRVLIGESGREQKDANAAVAEGRLWEVDGLNRYGDTRVRDLLRDATRGLVSADTVVHSIDVTGLGSDQSLTQMRSPEDPQRFVPGRESLNLIASDTGGRFFKDTNNLEAVVREMSEMTSRYYVLGFQPAGEKGPGEYHKIKVRVARKGVRLSHRAGYFEKFPVASQTPMQRQFEAAQLVMTGVGQNDLGFSALCLPFPTDGDRQTLGLVLQVPKASLPWTAGRPLAVEVYGYAVAQDETVVDHFAQLIRIDPRQADPDGAIHGLSLFATLGVAPGRYTIRLMVNERESGSAGVQFLDVNVPPRDARHGFLLPPLVVDDPGSWLTAEMGRGRSGAAAVPFQVNGEPFVPRATFQLQPGQPQKVVLIAFEPDGPPGDPGADIQIRSSLTDKRGQSVPAGFLRVQKVHHDGNGRRTYVLGYTPEVSLPGDYTLRVAVGEAGSRLESYSLLKLVGGGS